MIAKEVRIESNRLEALRGFLYEEKHIGGYFLTVDQLKELVRDFQVDCHDGFVSNDEAYIEEWLKKH